MHDISFLTMLTQNRQLIYDITPAPDLHGYEVMLDPRSEPVVCVKHKDHKLITHLIGTEHYITRPVKSMRIIRRRLDQLRALESNIVASIDKLIAGLDIQQNCKLPLILAGWEIAFLIMRLDIEKDDDLINVCQKFYDEYILQFSIMDDSTEIAKFISDKLVEVSKNYTSTTLDDDFSLSKTFASKTIHKVSDSIRAFNEQLNLHDANN